MKEKYIEEQIPRWYIFGEHPITGNVDVSDGQGDVLTNISKQLAEEVIKERDKFVDGVVAYWMERPEEFNRLCASIDRQMLRAGPRTYTNAPKRDALA